MAGMKVAISLPDPVFRAAKAVSGLSRHSVVDVSQVLIIDKALLTDRVRPLSAEAMQRVDNGLRLVLGL